MIKELSILIPVYNDNPIPLVKELSCQARNIDGLCYEILVIDDGSTDKDLIRDNEAVVNALPCCRYILEKHNDCRSAMRNNMVRHGRYDWHLMVDARLKIMKDDFLWRYLDSGALCGEAVCGGVMVDGGGDTCRLYKENLRFRYEKNEEKNHSVELRLRYPYKSFRTTNFFYHHTVLERVPYDERIKGYGYEDVMLGKAFERERVVVRHIDNPVAYTSFEDNKRYLEKIEEAMYTLNGFADELTMYSPVLRFKSIFRKYRMLWAMRLWHNVFSWLERKQLCGNSPSLLVFKVYKFGFLCRL